MPRKLPKVLFYVATCFPAYVMGICVHSDIVCVCIYPCVHVIGTMLLHYTAARSGEQAEGERHLAGYN